MMEASTSKVTIEQQRQKLGSPLLALVKDPTRAKLIKQGAEAKVYKIDSLFENTSLRPNSRDNGSEMVSSSPPTSGPLLLKHRFPKAYRHETLDRTLTRTRVNHEVKCLTRCLKAGIDVPAVKGVDVNSGIILMDWIEGHGSVREVLGGLPEEADAEDSEDDDGEQEEENVSDRLKGLELNEDVIMSSIGECIGAMHSIDVIHGDLTTSNMLLRRANDPNANKVTSSSSSSPSANTLPSIVLIDFGLSYVSTLVEDKAVDLYVLERAMASTHPEDEMREKKEERYIEKILAAYSKKIGEKEWNKVEKRLKDVRLRGRKRSMVG